MSADVLVYAVFSLLSPAHTNLNRHTGYIHTGRSKHASCLPSLTATFNLPHTQSGKYINIYKKGK